MGQPITDGDEHASGILVQVESLRPTLLRIARIAKTLFDVSGADVTVVEGERYWRASDRGVALGVNDPASGWVQTHRERLWTPDLTLDDRFLNHSSVLGGPWLRFFAGAPVILEDGACVGALGVFDHRPRPFDTRLAARLDDLAALVAHEFDRAQLIRDRSEVLDRVTRSEQRLERAAENAGIHVYELDFERETLFTCGAEDSFFLRSRTYDEMVVDSSASVHPDDREMVMAAWRETARSGIPYRLEYRLAREDGQEVWGYNTAELIKSPDGKPLRMIGTLQNITDRKRVEADMVVARRQAEAANIAKSTFLATMSHEIRTPLNGVLGMAQAMAADDLNDVQRERLDVISQSGEALLAILNDVLDLSKIEAGKLELEEIDFDLGELVRGAHAAFTQLANKKGVSFDLSLDGARGVYRGDPTRIRQILYNLISNALKFTDTGDIRVTARWTGEVLRLAVADTGVGMSAEVAGGLFSAFTQADASTTRRFGGTGLGLAICRHLATMMGGGIVVESEVGRGSTFTVDLPLPRIGDGKARSARSAPPKAAEEALQLRVLAAEDNTINQLVLKTLLHQVGIEPVVVENGALAVAAWEADAFDVILMDVQMPVMDGPTAARTIRRREAETGRPHTPIIALTANAMAHQIAEYFAAGMDAHVAKPIEAGKLFAALQAALDPQAEVGAAVA